MSIYHKESVKDLHRVMVSIWYEQSIKPDEIVLVQDGKLNDLLYEEIQTWKEILNGRLVIVDLINNKGLGNALDQGIQHCSYEIIARMDIDDIALPNRFEKQLNIFRSKDIDICGSWISEFDQDENTIVSFRKVPEYHDEITMFAKHRNPLNHPSVMYKKKSVLNSGGYKHMKWFEDYFLWCRMISNGMRFYNIQEPLVKMQAGYDQLKRRSGLKYAVAEYQFQSKLLDLEFINRIEFAKNISVRLLVRLFPKWLLKGIYTLIRNHR